MKELLVGLNVVDEDEYLAYREKMLPILIGHGGGFRYDFVVSKTLKSETSAVINRVFVICFPDTVSEESFFNDADSVSYTHLTLPTNREV